LLLLADADIYDFHGLLDGFFFAEGDTEGFEGLDEHPGRVVADVGKDEIEREFLLAEGKLKLALFIGKSVPVEVPWMRTVAPGRGSPVLPSTTTPVRICAHTQLRRSKYRISAIISNLGGASGGLESLQASRGEKRHSKLPHKALPFIRREGR